MILQALLKIMFVTRIVFAKKHAPITGVTIVCLSSVIQTVSKNELFKRAKMYRYSNQLPLNHTGSTSDKLHYWYARRTLGTAHT
jgi:hypothetical protein